MFKVVEQVLTEATRCGHVPTVSEAKMRSLVEKKSVGLIIVKSIMSNTGFIVPIAETTGKMMDSAFN